MFRPHRRQPEEGVAVPALRPDWWPVFRPLIGHGPSPTRVYCVKKAPSPPAEAPIVRAGKRVCILTLVPYSSISLLYWPLCNHSQERISSRQERKGSAKKTVKPLFFSFLLSWRSFAFLARLARDIRGRRSDRCGGACILGFQRFRDDDRLFRFSGSCSDHRRQQEEGIAVPAFPLFTRSAPSYQRRMPRKESHRPKRAPSSSTDHPSARAHLSASRPLGHIEQSDCDRVLHERRNAGGLARSYQRADFFDLIVFQCDRHLGSVRDGLLHQRFH